MGCIYRYVIILIKEFLWKAFKKLSGDFRLCLKFESFWGLLESFEFDYKSTIKSKSRLVIESFWKSFWILRRRLTLSEVARVGRLGEIPLKILHFARVFGDFLKLSPPAYEIPPPFENPGNAAGVWISRNGFFRSVRLLPKSQASWISKLQFLFELWRLLTGFQD